MYMTARGWGLPPSEFWGMTLGEWCLEAAWHAGQVENGPSVPGVLKPSEFDRLRAMIED